MHQSFSFCTSTKISKLPRQQNGTKGFWALLSHLSLLSSQAQAARFCSKQEIIPKSKPRRSPHFRLTPPISLGTAHWHYLILSVNKMGVDGVHLAPTVLVVHVSLPGGPITSANNRTVISLGAVLRGL